MNGWVARGVVLKLASDKAALDEININLGYHQKLNENFNFDLNPASLCIVEVT